ncbi:MAG: hypothetical protein ACOYXT_23650 [Bacteroidota bacterium]
MINRSLRPLFAAVATLLAALLLITCSDIFDTDQYDIEGVKVNSTNVFPLAYGELGINDFLNDEDSSYLKVDADGLLYLSYEQELRSQAVGDLLDFPDKSFIKNVPLPPATISATSSDVVYATLNDQLDFAFNPEQLSELIMRGGAVNITTTVLPATPANFSYSVLVELPDFKLNNVPFAKSLTNNASFTLSGYQAKFTNDVTPIKITVTKKAHGSPIIIPANTSVRVTLSFGGLEHRFVAGFFGDQTATLPDESLEITAFDNSLEGVNVTLAAPKASFEVTNEYGVPVKVNFLVLEARKAGGGTLPITLNPASPIVANYPTQPGQSAKTTVQIANTKQLLDFEPDEFFYRMTARINSPDIAVPNNFAFDTAKLIVKLRADVPLYGTASGIVLDDTVDIDLDDLEESEVESASLKAKIINDLPLDATLQIYMVTENFAVLDSLLLPNQTSIVRGSTVNASGDLQSPGVFDEEIPISKSKIDKLFNTDRLIIKARMNTIKNANGTQPDVKFKSSYKMNVKLGLKATLKVSIDL